MRFNSKKLLVTAGVFGLCVMGTLCFQSAHVPKGTAFVEAGTFQRTGWKRGSQASPDPFPSRRRPILSPSAATAFVLPEPPEDPDEAREWARKNPQDALACMLNAPADEKRDTVAETACAQVAE